MTQDEAWQKHYDEIVKFVKTNKRCPSKHRPEDRRMVNWMKYNRKLINKDAFPAERLKRFNRLLTLCEKYRHINQYE